MVTRGYTDVYPMPVTKYILLLSHVPTCVCFMYKLCIERCKRITIGIACLVNDFSLACSHSVTLRIGSTSAYVKCNYYRINSLKILVNLSFKQTHDVTVYAVTSVQTWFIQIQNSYFKYNWNGSIEFSMINNIVYYLFFFFLSITRSVHWVN